MKQRIKNLSGWPGRKFNLLPLLYYFGHGSLIPKCFQSFPKSYLRDSYNSKAILPFGAV